MNNRISVATIDSPEFINLQPMDINPLMSKCDVKVLYIGQNRNKSCITKKVATEMSKTLRGCPIVGYYIEKKEDFGDHGDQVIIDGDGIKFNKLTKPYGFVAPDSKVWFQFFEDTDEFGNTVVREYLMTEGYLWTGQFEECKRVLDNNNPQSMELDEKSLKGYWSTDNNQGVDFFIINDAVFSKLCILGDDVEPCFEGANVSAPTLSSQFSKDDNFTKDLFTMMNELKFALNNNEGGQPMHNEIQNELDNNVEATSFENQENVEVPATQFEDGGDAGSTDGESSDSQNPTGEAGSGEPSGDGDNTPSDEGEANPGSGETQPGGEVVTPPAEGGDSEVDVTEGVVLTETDEAILETLDEDYAPEGESNLEALIKDGATNVPKTILQNAKKKDDEEEKNEDKEEKSDSEKSEDNTEDKEEKEDSDDEKKKKKFSLEEELQELQVQFAALQEENAKLLAFKQEVENKEKDELIASFYMLSDEDKKNVIENKANYSLREIKAELSMICVDKKISFDTNSESSEPITYNLNAVQADTTPAWLARVKEVHDARNK